jgi:hypothetical protein
MALPVDIPYFLESYEACLQLTEWLESELDQHWHSSEREAAREVAPSQGPHADTSPFEPISQQPPPALPAPKKTKRARSKRTDV